MTTARAKICGLASSSAIRAAAEGGAAMIGLVFHPASPRNVAMALAGELAATARASGLLVAVVTVDADDAALQRIVSAARPDLIQLHGRETPERAAQVGALTGARTVKALRVSQARDVDAAVAFQDAVDYLMFDATPPAGAVLPGGNGAAFDWHLLAGRRFARPWFLAGGLDAGNVARAVHESGATLVDVSSGVERAPGVKDPGLIKAFLEALRRDERGGGAEPAA